MHDVATLTDIIGRHAPADGTWDTAIPGLALIRSSRPTPAVHAVSRPSLCLVTQGRKRMVLGERVLEYNRHNLLVIPVELPLVGQVTEASVEHPYLCLRLDLDPGLLAEQVIAHTEGVPAERETGPGIVELTEEFANSCRRLVACLDSPQEISWLAPLVSREIHGRLLAGEASALARRIAIGSSAGIGRATAWIKSHLDEPVSVAGLAHIAGMSRSAFHRHFLSVTGLSPLKYQQRMRLLEARRLMVATGAQAGTAAFAVGYGSAAQFSREYARMFEVPPARDARNLREGVATRARIGLAGH